MPTPTSLWGHTLTSRLEHTDWLDRLEEPLAKLAAPIQHSDWLKTLLSGAPLGHRLHPALTDVVIGAWLSAGVVDTLRERGEEAADALVALGLVSSGPTVLAGLSDWADTSGPDRRVGIAHAAANSLGFWLHLASLLARRAGHRGLGRALSFTGLGVLLAGAYLGGHLSYTKGVGVAADAFERPAREWTPVARPEEVGEEPHAAQANGQPVLLVRSGDAILALGDTCSHAGCSLAHGQRAGDSVICSCHGSRFDLRTGAVQRGPAATPQPSYETRLRDGMVEVRLRT